MAQRTPLTFTDEDCEALRRERYEHPHPRVQQRMEGMWLLSQGLTRTEAGRLAGVSRSTVERYVTAWRQGGLTALRASSWEGPVSDLTDHRDVLAEAFRQQPPHPVAEACGRIEAIAGVKRRPTQVRKFLKKAWV